MKVRFIAALMGVSLLDTISPLAHTADFFWDTDASTGGNLIDGANLGGAGSWDTTSANWWDLTNLVVWPNLTGSRAFFTYAYSPGLPTDNTVTVSFGITANALHFLRSGYTLSGGDITLAGATPALHANLGEFATISSQILGADGLTKTGGGSIRLSNNSNSYTGATTIANGTLIITDQGALGSDTSAIVVRSFNPVIGSTNRRGFGGGSLALDGTGGDITISRDLSLQGQGPIADRGTALLSWGVNTLSGTVDMGVDQDGTNLNTRVTSADGTLNLTGTLNVLGTATSTINSLGGTNQAGASFYNVTGVLAGTGTLEGAGGGTLFLNPTDASGFSGTVRVSGSAASGQSVVRIDSPDVLGTRTGSGTSSVIDMNGGILAILMDSPSVQSGGVNANVYGRDGSTFFADHTPNSAVKDQTVAFGSFLFEENETFTFNSRNGYGMSFSSTTVNGGNNNSTFANNLQGGALLTFSGNFWNNNDNGASRTLTFSGNGDTLITGNILATSATYDHNLTKTGTGTLTIASTGATLDGTVNVNGGTVAIADWRSINNNTAIVDIGTGGTSATLSVVGNNRTLAQLTTSKVINLGGTTGGATILANQTGTSPGLVLDANWTATAGSASQNKTVTLGGTNTAANTINGVIPNNNAGGLVNLRKIDPGTWALAGSNTYTGSTTITNGILKLRANDAASTIVNDASAIVFTSLNNYAGGALEFVGQLSVNNVEALGALTPSNGHGIVRLTPGSGGTASLVFDSLGAVGGGGTLNFVTPNGGNTFTFTTSPASDNIANAGLFFNGSNFAFTTAGGLVRAPIYGTDPDFSTSASALAADESNEITGSFSTGGALGIDSLRIAGSHTLTLDGDLTIRTAGGSGNSGGILQTGGSGTITGAFNVGTNNSAPLVINVNGGGNSLTLESTLLGTGGFTKTGSGTLRLAGTNTQTGTITINQGTVRLVGSGQLGGASNLTIRQDGVLELNGITPSGNTRALNNNGIIRNTSATTDVTFTLGSGNQGGTSYGIIEDGGLAKVNVVKIGSGGQSWFGLSTYTGTTTIGSTAIVSINSLEDGGLPSGIGASSNAASNLVFNGASTSQNYGGLSYTGPTNGYTDRLFTFNGGANGGARILSSGANGGTSVWTNTGALEFGPNATGNPQGLVLGGTSTGDNRFFPLIANNGAAATSVYKADAGVWYLEGANTYTGATELRGGALYVRDGASLPTASNLVFNGGIVASTGTLSRTLGTGSGQMRFAAPATNTAAFRGGFAAGGSKLTVDWGSTPTWGSTANFLNTRDGLIFGAAHGQTSVAKADIELVSSFSLGTGSGTDSTGVSYTLANSSSTVTVASTAGLVVGQSFTGTSVPSGAYIVSINSATQFSMSSSAGSSAGGSYSDGAFEGGALRAIRVDDNTSIGADFATISGVISGNAGTGIRKLGAGILVLSGANTYDGETSVYQGTLVVKTLGHSANPGPTSVGDSTNGATNTAAVTLGNGGAGAGILEYVGPGETSDRKIRLNSTTGGNQIHADGAGPLILTNVANDMTAGAKLLYLRGVNSGGNLITSQLSDNGGALGIVVDGGTSWILSNSANDFTGTVSTNAGALGVGSDTALGTALISFNNGNLFAYGADRTLANPVEHDNNTTMGFLGDYSLTFTQSLSSNAAANNFGTNNNLAAGKALTFTGITADSLTANRTWTIDGSGTTIVNGDITTTTSHGLNITKTGDGALVLNGTGSNFNQNGANIDIDRGTLQLGASEVIPHGAGYGDLILSPELANGDIATLDLNGQTETINGLTANTDGAATIDNTSASAAQLIFGANDAAVSFGGGVGAYTITDSGTGALSIKKIGAADAVIPSGVTLTYEGATEVNGGSTFTIAAPLNGTTSLIVRDGGSRLRLTGGLASPSLVTSITVEDGGTLSLLDGEGNKIDSLTDLQLGSSSGSMSNLNLNVGDQSGAGDELNTDFLTLFSGGTLSLFSGNQVIFNLTDTGLNANQSYDLLSFVDGGFTSGVLGSGDWLLGATPGGFDSMTLNVTDTLIQLQTGNLVTGALYWRGLTDNTWNANVDNWSTDKAGSTPATIIPGQGNDVVFAYDGASGALATTLEQNFKINSLTFEPGTSTPTSVTIDPGAADPNSRIEVAPAAGTDGIKITTGGPASVSINASSGFVRLGSDQTWDVADASSVLTLGTLQGEADVAISGSGKIVLTSASAPTFNSGVTADFSIAGATLEIQNATALGSTVNANLATVSIGSGGAFYYNGAANTAATGVANDLTLAGGTLSAGGNAGNNYYTGSALVSADSAINMRGSNSPVLTATQGNVVLSGPVSGTGRLSVDSINTVSSGNQITGTLYLQGDNSAWSGGFDLTRGTIQVQNVNGFGTGDVTASGGRIQFNMPANNTVNLGQNFTVDAPGGMLELSVDAQGALSGDLAVNLNGIVTLGSASNADNALRINQATDNFSVFEITNSVVLGNNASISVAGSSVRPAIISGIISDGGSGYALAVNDDQGGWNQTNRTLRLTGANTFSGDLTLASGILEFDTVTGIAGAASSLGQGSAVTITGSSTLRFIGASAQSTDRPITSTAGVITLSANGATAADSITYSGAITVGPTGDGSQIILTGAAGSEGVIAGGITQSGTTADATVNGATWTHQTGTSYIGDDLTVTGADTILNLTSGLFQVRDDFTVTSGATLNLNGTGVLSFNTPSLSGDASLRATAGGTIILGADDAVEAIQFDSLQIGTDADGLGTLDMGGYDLTVVQFLLGNRSFLRSGLVNGTGTLTVTGNLDLYDGTIHANLASTGATALEKLGSGTVTLRGDNSGLASTGASILYGGTLVLDYTASNTDKLRAASALDMRGATLQVVGNDSVATSQTVASFTMASGGSSTIQVIGGAGQDAVLNLGAITRGNNAQDGTVRFILPSGAQSATHGITTTSPNSTFGMLGTGASATSDSAYATVDEGTGVWFATNDGSGNIVALISTAKDDVTTWVPGDHVTDSTGFTGGPLSCASIFSLRFDAPSGSDLVVAEGSVLSIGSGGFLVTGNVGGTPSLMGGTVAPGTTELVITQDGSQPFEIGSRIPTDTALTKSGPGTLLLSGSNRYTGETEIQDGILQVSGGNAIGDTSPVTLAAYRDSTLELLANETIGRLGGGQRQTDDNHGLVIIGSRTLTINQTSSANYAGYLTGTGNIVKLGTGNLQLTNASDGFTGIVTVDNGMLYLSGVGQINASILRVNKGGALLFDNNGTTRSGARILDTTPVTLNSADGSFSGQTIVRGFGIRTDQNAATNETVGAVNFASGANYLYGDAQSSTGTARAAIIADDFVRLNNATLNARARSMGLTSGHRNNFRIGDSDNETAFLATLTGGGGAGGTTNISILPWGIGEQLSAALADGNMGNSLITYDAGNGFRALDFATEYDDYGSGSSTSNVRESLTADATGLPGRTLNALVLDNASTSASTIAITGAGTGQSIVNTSGAFLLTLNPGADASSAHQFTVSGFDSGIAVGGGEYLFFVVNPSAAATTPTLTLQVDSALTSSADLVKSGRGTLILTNTGNTAGGGSFKTVLNEGILEIADLANIGGDTGDLVFAGGTLRFGAGLTDDISQRTITFLQGGATLDTNGIDLALADSVGSGIGGLTKTGAGNLTLNSGATYTGATLVTGGALTVGADDATGSGGDLTIGAGATLAVGSYSINHNLVTISGADPVLSGTGTITAASGFFFDHDGGTDLVTVDAVLAGPGGVLKANRNSNLTLNGLNTFTGPLEVYQGTLSFNSIGNVGGGSSALGAPGTVEDGVIRMGYTTGASALTYTGSGDSTDRIIELQGSTGGVTINANGTGALALDTIKGAKAGTKTLTLSGSSDGSIDNTVALIEECVATLNLAKSGSNTWLLTGANNYSGSTFVNDGTLKIGVTDSLPTTTAVRIGTGSTAGTLDLNGFDQTIGSMTVQSTINAVTNNILIPTGNTLTINGAVTLGVNANASTTDVVASGGGSMVVNSGGANFQIGGATGGTNDNKVTADFSGLSSFTANLGAGTFRLGDSNTGTEDNASNFILAENNSITAALIRIGDGSGGAFTHTLTLGSGTNTLNADTINVGSAGSTIRSGGAVIFDPGDTTGAVTIRASDGASRATLNMVNTTGNTAGHMTSIIDFTGHAADVLVDTLTMAARTQNTGAGTATFSFDQGTLDILTLNMASRTGSGTGDATATLNIGGGTGTIGSTTMAVNTSAGGTVTAALNVTGGAVTIGTGSGTAIHMANAGTGRTVTSTIDLTGGTVDVTGNIIRQGGAGTENATVTLNGSLLDMNGFHIGSATETITLTAGSGTLQNLGELNGGGALTKTTGGVLTMQGTNTYTGATNISDGILLVNGDNSGATGSVSVSSGATLGGSGTLGGATTIDGTLSTGADANVGTVGSLAFNGQNLTFNDNSTWLVDIVQGGAPDSDAVTGVSNLTINGTVELVLAFSGTYQLGNQYTLASYTGLWSGTFQALSGGSLVTLTDDMEYDLDGGGRYLVNYNDTSGFTLTAVPEPTSLLPLALLLIAGLLPRRRRRVAGRSVAATERREVQDLF